MASCLTCVATACACRMAMKGARIRGSSGAVVIIPVLDSGDLLFERQYRYPVGQAFLELPAGKIDSSEAIADTAVRELREETGHKAADWRYLGVMHPCIGYSNERIEIFLARGLTGYRHRSSITAEFLDVLPLSLDDAIAAVRSGELTNDAKTITALFWAERCCQAPGNEQRLGCSGRHRVLRKICVGKYGTIASLFLRPIHPPVGGIDQRPPVFATVRLAFGQPDARGRRLPSGRLPSPCCAGG